MNNVESIESLCTITRLTKDIMEALRRDIPGGITDNHARFLVDEYYQIQKARIRYSNYGKGLDRDAQKSGNDAEPHLAIDSFVFNYAASEENIRKLLTWYISDHEMFWFFERTLGIGPVLAAGLMAHIDIEKCPTVGHIWAFAGLDPNRPWLGREKAKSLLSDLPGKDMDYVLHEAAQRAGRNPELLRVMATRKPDGSTAALTRDRLAAAMARKPHNGPLKTLCWKIGESFVKLSGRQDAFYAQVYKRRKQEEWSRNLAGEYQDAARASMASKQYGKGTDQYAWYTGLCSPVLTRALLADGKPPVTASCIGDGGIPMLSPAHIHARASRYAVKLFLSHLHECWYRQHFGQEPPKPFALAIGGHAHYIAPPQVENLAQAA